ncbi:MAG: MerR family transcriptional regulator [Alicyclobacillus sp.]|nr:MerR family transcriptional regulator [Alicyclobacillus sp.]
MMTIGQFSERTGLRPKTLRYYEEVALLIPAERLENGYRLYAEEQVDIAQFIHSLRQADVPISAIREFLRSTRERREELLAKWRREASVKLLSIQVANQFLSGLNPNTKHMQLVSWDVETDMLWVPCESAITDQWNPRDEIDVVESQLLAENLILEQTAYIRFTGPPDDIRPEVGFVCTRGESKIGQKEILPPTLFATIECRDDLPYSCVPVLSTVRRFGFASVGVPMRKYPSFLKDRYIFMIPVASFPEL